MISEKLGVDCSLSEIGLISAANKLGGVALHELTVYASAEARVYARKLQGQFGFGLVLVPPEIMLNTHGAHAWCVEHPRGIVWTNGY